MFDRLNSRASAVSHRLYRLSFVSLACGTGAANAFAPEVWPTTLKEAIRALCRLLLLTMAHDDCCSYN
jgi:hypothetical protein